MAEITPERCTVLAETAELLEGMMADKARAQLEAARQAVETATCDARRHAAEKQLLMTETIAAIM